MRSDQLENLVRLARGLDPDVLIDCDEEWDSLDHLAVLGALQDEMGENFGQVDLSTSNSLAKLEQLICVK